VFYLALGVLLVVLSYFFHVSIQSPATS
jgi:hypothetical protein